MDPHLDRKNITKESVDEIRNRLIHSKTLFYAVTDNTAGSTWMPWELGFIDGYRAKSAVLPITDKSPSEFKGAEFIAVYPRVAPLIATTLSIVDIDGNFVNNFEPWRDSIPERPCGMPKCPK